MQDAFLPEGPVQTYWRCAHQKLCGYAGNARTDQLEKKDVESFRCSTQIDRYLTAFLKCPEQIR